MSDCNGSQPRPRVASGRLVVAASVARGTAFWLALAGALGGCVALDTSPSSNATFAEDPSIGASVLTEVRGLAVHDPLWSSALATSGWRRDERMLLGPGVAAEGRAPGEFTGTDASVGAPAAPSTAPPRLHARLAASSSGPLWVGAGGDVAARLPLTFEGHAHAVYSLSDGVAVARDALPATDVLATVDGARVEVFYLLRGVEAPTTWRWSLGASPTLTPRQEGEAVVLADAAGEARLRLSAPGAVDATGTRFAVTTRLEGRAVHFTLDVPEGAHVAHPVLVDPVVEIVDWTLAMPQTSPIPRNTAALAYDAARGRTVLFGGQNNQILGDTWEWDGTSWTERTPATRPMASQFPLMVYDAARARTVLFSRERRGATVFVSATWEWDGVDWTDRTSATGTAPSPRSAPSLVYDGARRRVLLFGGVNYYGSALLNDLWAWDGSTWSLLTPATRPLPRHDAAMGYDAARERVVLFGGLSASTGGIYLSDVWEWDGSDWAERTPASGIAGRAFSTFWYDSTHARLELLGGGDATGFVYDQWAWDGTSWSARSPTVPAPRAYRPAIAFDEGRGRAVMFGGIVNSTYGQRTFESDGTTWEDRTPTTAPLSRYGHAMTFDRTRNVVLLYGGPQLNDTWEWDGSRWTQRTPVTSPPAQTGAQESRLAYDSARERAVLFIGRATSATWEWDGTNWLERASTNQPTAQATSTLVFDEARGRTVLFGGIGPMGRLAETWEWDGTDWALRSPTNRPSARNNAVMAYDATRRRVVLFGGLTSSGLASDTWSWDGTDWHLETPPSSPPALGFSAMTFDASRDRVLLFGWRPPDVTTSEAWEWDGTTWTEIVTATRPWTRIRSAMAYDAARARTVLFGGTFVDLGLGRNDTWTFGSSRTLGSDCTSSTQCGSGHCVDGVCCESACGGGALDDCSACSVAAGATRDGACAALDAVACSDGSACTTGDRCRAGTCEGAGSPCLGGTACALGTDGGALCGACPAGTSSADGTGLTACVPCTDGTWSTEGAARCERWSDCVAGRRVSAPGSASADRECIACEAGTFSTTTNADTCTPCTVCGPGQLERTACAPAADTECVAETPDAGGTPDAGPTLDAGLDGGTDAGGMTDAGPRADAGPDGAVAVDAGASPPGEGTGCACRVGPRAARRGEAASASLAAAILGLVVARHRRRAAR